MSYAEQLRQTRAAGAFAVSQAVRHPLRLLPAALIGCWSVAFDPFALMMRLSPFVGMATTFLLLTSIYSCANTAYVALSVSAEGRRCGLFSLFLFFFCGQMGALVAAFAPQSLAAVPLVLFALGLPALLEGRGVTAALGAGLRRAVQRPLSALALVIVVVAVPFCMGTLLGALRRSWPGEMPLIVLWGSIWLQSAFAAAVFHVVVLGAALGQPEAAA